MGYFLSFLSTPLSVPLGDQKFNIRIYYIVILVILAASTYLLYLFSLIRKNKHKNHYFLEITFPQISKEELENYIRSMKTLFSTLHNMVKSNTDKIFIEVLKKNDYISIYTGSNSKEITKKMKGIFSQIENLRIKAKVP